VPDARLVKRANDLIRDLSFKPRFAGSAEEAEARAFCAKELEGAGLRCIERPFEYSEWPGKWGIPAAAVVQLATIFAVSRIAIMTGPLVALIVGAALYIGLIAASADAKRRWVQGLPFLRARSVNLEATRGDPNLWLVAHLDSKSQTVPMIVRIASSVALALVMVVTVVALLASIAGVVVSRITWPAIEIAAVVAALPSMLCFVRNDTHGALDNASGIASVVLAAGTLADLPALGVLITSGEELGLAGARIWAAQAKRQSFVLNCDSIDDRGRWRLMYTGSRPRRISVSARTISDVSGSRIRVSRMIPGILADSMAFADRGIEAVTLSRGTISSLARIHTRRDTSIALSGSGVADASAVLAALTRKLS
jgi:heme/copper-type cytochrome/quinol oxidase subunit 4